MHRFRLSLATCVVLLSAAVPSAALADAQPQPIMSAPLAAEELTHAEQQAQDWWSTNEQQILAGFQTGAGAGQCTSYVVQRRPDVIQRGDSWAFVNYLLLSQTGPLIVNWLAKDWAAQAAWAGLPEGRTPQPGAVIVFQPGAYGAGSGGHVAIVDKVNRNGSFRISEMHAPKLDVVTKRSFGRKVSRAMAEDPRITFIYR